MGFAWILHDVNLRHWVQSFETEAIVDVDRLKDCCPEDIASIWDDVISHFLLFQFLFLYCFLLFDFMIFMSCEIIMLIAFKCLLIRVPHCSG